MAEQPPLRRIRSFVRREGRLTTGQERALERLFPVYGLEQTGQPLDFQALFGRDAPVVVEIGFGNGVSLAAMAAAQPERNFLGIEVHRPGVGGLLQLVEQQDLQNVRVICADAVEVLQTMIPDQSLDMVCLYFPDPWPKKRHHKRRILQPGFVQLLRSKLRMAAIFHCATDWQNYAEQMLDVMTDAEGFTNTVTDGEYASRPDWRPLTKFEQRGQRLGHGVWDLLFRKTG